MSDAFTPAQPTVPNTVLSSPVPTPLTPQLRTDLVLYDTFYIFGFASLSVIFLTAWLSPRIQRASLWFLFIFSWIFTSIISVLLIGKQTGPLPSPTLCLSQAILLYSGPVFSAYCGLSYIVHLYFSLLAVVKGRSKLVSNGVVVTLHIIPCITLVGMGCLVLVLTSEDFSIVQRDPSGMYCHVTNPLPAKVEGTLIIVAMAVLAIVEVLIFLQIRQAWMQLNRLGQLGGHGNADNMFIDALVRSVIFTLLPIVSLVMSILDFLPKHENPVSQYAVSNIVVALIPATATFIFGTQRDILRVWTCRACPTSELEDRKSQAMSV